MDISNNCVWLQVTYTCLLNMRSRLVDGNDFVPAWTGFMVGFNGELDMTNLDANASKPQLEPTSAICFLK